MSQFDFGNLESPLSGSNFINANLEPWRDALHSLHKGPSTPSYAVAGMMWIDDSVSPWVLNIFDGTDNISVGTVDPTTNTFTPSGVSQDAADISVDNSGFQVFNGDDVQEVLGEVDSFADSLGTAASEDVGTSIGDVVQLEDIGGGVAGLPAVDGSQLLNLPVKTTFGAPIATTAGSAIEVTSIPSAVKRIIINFSNVGTNGTAVPLLQLGDTGGYETSGYQGSVDVNGAAEVLSAGAAFTRSATHSSSAKYNGTLTLSLLDASTRTWSLSGDLARSDSGLLSTIACSKSLTDPLDKLRLYTTDAWNSGKINVIMES